MHMTRGTSIKGNRNAEANELITFERNIFNHQSQRLLNDKKFHNVYNECKTT